MSVPRIRLKKLDDSSNTSEPIDENEFQSYVDILNTPKNDQLYGIRAKHDKLWIGKVNVSLSPSHITVYGRNFRLTRGLLDLLFLKYPAKENITESDLLQYKEILILTSAHKKDYDDKKEIRRTKSKKFVEIIDLMFPLKKGGCISKQCKNRKLKHLIQNDFMLYNPRKQNYVYWDDPNELVERLYLLLSSKQAGHTGHQNEVLSIFEELREANIIQ